MREIKFRALKDDMSNCNFVYGYLVITPDGTPRITNDVGGLFHTCLKGTEGQYTGVKDKNGKECYEKDYDADGTMIDWCEECCGYEFFQIDVPTGDIIFCHRCEGNLFLQDHINEFKIVGNLHEKKNKSENKMNILIGIAKKI